MRFRIMGGSVALAVAALLPAVAQAARYTVSAGPPAATTAPVSFQQGLYDAEDFYPGSTAPIRVHTGDTITFVGSFHTATILGNTNPATLRFIASDPAHGVYGLIKDAANNPFYFSGKPKLVYNSGIFAPMGRTVVTSTTALYSSGLLGGGPSPTSYTFKFAKPGTYHLVCLLHPYMHGTIIVVGRRVRVPAPRADIKTGLAEANRDVLAAIAADESQPRAVQDPRNATVWAGGGNSKRFTLFGFYPAALSVKVGTVVTFRNGSPNEGHSVGIGDYNYQIPFITATDLFPTGPGSPNQVGPALVYGTDPAVGGVYTYTGAASHGNGFFATSVVTSQSGLPLPSQVKVRFTAPGTYTYICQIHENMVATINVHP
jgi:plastocyanin